MSFTFGATPAAGTSNLFGGASQNTTAPKTTFGGFSTPNPQQQQGQQQQSNTGGLFGSQTAQPANPAPFSFGNTSTSAPAGQTQQTGGGLFGGGQQQQQQQQQQQNSLFGNNQAKPSTGLFSSSTQPQQQQQQQGGGMFGSTAATQPAAPSTGLFGSTSTQPQSNLFGSTNQTQPQSNSLFGSAQPQQQQQSSLFGNTSTNALQPQQQGQLSSSLFASTSGSGNALANSISGSQRPEVAIGERMMAVQRAWDTSNPECKFKYFFYNVVEPGQAQQYGRPAGANDEAKWIKALRENPDPNCMVPVLATGWADVKKRSQMQEQIASVHQQKIKEISQALTTLSRQSNLTTSIRLTALQTQLAQLQHRLIRLAAQSPAFIPALQSSALRPEEVETKKTLESVKSELDSKKGSSVSKGGYGMAIEYGTPKKGSGVRMMGQVNELWGQVEEMRRYKGRRGGGGERDGWLADEKVLGEIAEVLATQQMALQKLNDLANDAVFDADVMRQGLGLISSHERHQT